MKPDFDSDPGWEGVEDWLHPKVPITEVRNWLLMKRESIGNSDSKKPKGAAKAKGKKRCGKKHASKESTNKSIPKSCVKTVCKKGKQEKISYQRGINEFISKARLGKGMSLCGMCLFLCIL